MDIQSTNNHQSQDKYLDPLGLAAKSEKELKNLFLKIFKQPTQAPSLPSLFANLTEAYKKILHESEKHQQDIITKQQKIEHEICDSLHLGEDEHVSTIDALSSQRDAFSSEKMNLEELLKSGKTLLEQLFGNAPPDIQDAFGKLQQALASKNKKVISDARYALQSLILKHQGASISQIEPAKESFLSAGAHLHTLLTSETSTTDELQKAYAARNRAQIAYMILENEFLELENEFYKDLAKQAGS